MKLIKAFKLAVDCIDDKCHQLSVQANLYEKYNMDSGKRDWERREELREARDILTFVIKDFLRE